MELIRSAAETDRLRQQPQASSVTAKTSGSFSDVLDKAWSSLSEDMDSIFEEAAALFDIPVNLLKAVAKTESGFNADAVSGAGAMGVMQLMPQTAKSLGVSNPFDVRQNIMGGAKYLRNTLDQFGDVNLALAAYNAGPGNVRKYGGIPPFEETQNYVRKVTSYMNDGSLSAGKAVRTGSAASGSVSDAAQLGQLNQLSQMASALGGYSGAGSLTGADSWNVSDLYGGLNGLVGLSSGLGSMSAGLALGAAAYGSSDSYGMEQEYFSSLVQMLRIQMLMEADRTAGLI